MAVQLWYLFSDLSEVAKINDNVEGGMAGKLIFWVGVMLGKEYIVAHIN